MPIASSSSRLKEVADLLTQLHRHKDAAYGDAWRRRGEVIAIFANLARKYDRLERALDEEEPAATEPLADTVADLCVYAGKYLTWLAETRPVAFAAVPPYLDPIHATAEQGAAGLEAILGALPAWEEQSGTRPPDDVDSAWIRIATAFGELEAGLMAQAGAEGDPTLPWARKVELAWALTDASWHLLARLATEDPRLLQPLRDQVAAMDKRSPE
jgi:hypothetical protein